LGSFSDLTESAFGRWLVVKLILVALVVAAAAVSRRLSRSDDDDVEEHELVAVDGVTTAHAGGAATRAADDGALVADHGVLLVTDSDDVPTRAPQEAPAALRRSVVFEAVGLALILGATAGLVNSPPPPSAATTESASAVVGDRIAQVELEPAVTGGTEMHVYLSSPSGGLDSPDEITVEASLPSADLGPLEIETVPAGPNHVVADVDLPVAGLWTFEVTARFGEFDQVVFTVEIPVAD
jgi:copper transport protein